jgi:hypothetical protein
MARSKDELQRMAYHLNIIARKYKRPNPAQKKSMEMCGNHIQMVKIVINYNHN